MSVLGPPIPKTVPGTRFPLQLFMFAALMGVLAPFLQGYTYMAGDQLEYLPALERRLDPSYLPEDSFTDAATRFGPRFFFTEVTAFLRAHLSTPALYLALTLINNVCVSVLTALVGWRLFGESPAGGAFAAAVVMSVQGFSLGHAAYLHLNFLTPQHLATPFALGAIWSGMTGRILRAQFLAGMGALMHPILGLEAGGLALVASAVGRWRETAGAPDKRRAFLAEHGLGLLMLAAGAAIWAIPYAFQERIDTAEFLQILVYYRCPHHFLPSSFPARDYLDTVCFLLAAGVAWKTWTERIRPAAPLSRFPVALAGCLILLCLGAYVFVEIVPTRAWAQLQPFRMLVLLKWFGMVLCAGTVVLSLQHFRPPAERLAALVALLCLQTAPASALAFLNLRWGNRLPGRGSVGWLLASASALAFGVWNGLEIFLSWRQREVTAFLFLLLMATLFTCRFSRIGWGLNGALFLFLLVSTARPDLSPTPKSLRLHYPFSSFKPALYTEAHQFKDQWEIARLAAERTPPNALFLAPPQFAPFRLLARRALVTDIKCMPFSDKDLQAWYHRVLDCYHDSPPTHSIPWTELNPRLQETYRGISDGKILRLAETYGFGYVIQEQESETALPVMGEAGGYRLLEVGPHAEDDMRRTGAE